MAKTNSFKVGGKGIFLFQSSPPSQTFEENGSYQCYVLGRGYILAISLK